MVLARAAALGRWLHGVFEVGLIAKGLLAFLETAAGLGLLLTTNSALHRLAGWLTRYELAQDPTDRMALWFQQSAQGFTADSQHFYALYLVSHGVLKLLVVAGLVLRLRWSYPAAMVLLSGFILYQMYEWSLTGSPMLLALSAFDLLMIGLTWREYRLLGPAVSA
ncbi:MAG: DUF2127 domain-containing protein [Tabrizicola sp.]